MVTVGDGTSLSHNFARDFSSRLKVSDFLAREIVNTLSVLQIE